MADRGTVCRFWMDWYPEEFSRGNPLLQHLSSLQQAMDAAQDLELLDLVSSDGLLVGSHSVLTVCLLYTCCLFS